jgi:hypothetical protein
MENETTKALPSVVRPGLDDPRYLARPAIRPVHGNLVVHEDFPAKQDLHRHAIQRERAFDRQRAVHLVLASSAERFMTGRHMARKLNMLYTSVVDRRSRFIKANEDRDSSRSDEKWKGCTQATQLKPDCTPNPRQ